MPALEFLEISKYYRRPFGEPVRALDGLTLSVQEGEMLGFLGPNGAGKSTAIHLALGLMRPSGGEGRMLGQPFGHVPTRRRIGFLAENVAFYHLPAGRMVRFYGALNRIPEPQLSARTRELLELMGLMDVAGRKVSKFSRGMLQRAGLAQALVNDPDLLLLDEPTSALDPAARVAVRELLLDLRRRGKTVLLSSHLLSEIELICDRVAIIHRGRLARLGTTSELLETREQYEVVARGVTWDGAEQVSPGTVRFLIPATEQRQALERVWQQGGEVISVNPARRTLEEIFLELTSPSGGARS